MKFYLKINITKYGNKKRSRKEKMRNFNVAVLDIIIISIIISISIIRICLFLFIKKYSTNESYFKFIQNFESLKLKYKLYNEELNFVL